MPSQVVQTSIVAMSASTQHTRFDEGVRNIGLCMHRLGHVGPSVAFAGGVGGQMGRV